MVAVAHQVEHRIVAPEVAGSRPVSHPIFPNNLQLLLGGNHHNQNSGKIPVIIMSCSNDLV